MSINSEINLRKKRGIMTHFNMPNHNVRGIISLLREMKDPHETMIEKLTGHASVVCLVTKEEVLNKNNRIIPKQEMGLIFPHLALIKDQKAYVLCLNEEKNDYYWDVYPILSEVMMNQMGKDQTLLFARIMSDKETLNYLRGIPRDLVYPYAGEIMKFECAYKGNGKQMRK